MAIEPTMMTLYFFIVFNKGNSLRNSAVYCVSNFGDSACLKFKMPVFQFSGFQIKSKLSVEIERKIRLLM